MQVVDIKQEFCLKWLLKFIMPIQESYLKMIWLLPISAVMT